MAYYFEAAGTHSVSLPRESVKSFHVHTETPRTNDGRGTDTSVTMTIKGPIRSADDNAFVTDETIKLARWATEYEDAKAYSQATATATASGQVLRRDVYPDAFVVCYSERFDITKGVGTYNIILRQKKDLLRNIDNSGGFLD
jgi:hypothetical protein